MSQQEILVRLGLALAIGLLIGVERGWRERSQSEGARTAGLRTFALVGLSGGVWGQLAAVLGPVPLAAAFFTVAAGVTLFKWREAEKDNDFGATTLVAALLTFALGAYAVLGDMTGAAAAAVATTVLLATKRWLHHWVATLTWEELRATLILLVMSFVALPVLPDRGFGPFEALNPHALWLMTIAIAGVSFIGYAAVRFIGMKYGSLVAGVAGGLVSSTAATLDFARKAKARVAISRIELAGAFAASSIMFLRILVIVALFGPAFLPRLVAPLVAAAVVLFVAAIAYGATWTPEKEGDEADVFRNPFELFAVVRFAAMLALILIVSKWLASVFGGTGAIAVAGAAGLADLDAITLSMLDLGGQSISTSQVTLAILVAAGTNSLSKSAIAWFVGGPKFGSTYSAVTLAAVAAGAAVAGMQAWLI